MRYLLAMGTVAGNVVIAAAEMQTTELLSVSPQSYFLSWQLG